MVGHRLKYHGYVVNPYDPKYNKPGRDLKFKFQDFKISPTDCPRRMIGFKSEFINTVDVEHRYFTRFHADKRYWGNQYVAARHRFGCQMADPKWRIRNEFADFVRNNFKYFPRCTEWMSTNDWLEQSTYTAKFKARLKRDLQNADKLPYSNKCKAFIKDEGYDEVKAPRAINGHDNKTKAYLGAYVKSLEKTFFKHKFFVKGKTPQYRDQVLRETFGDERVSFTDFSHFESHHRGIYAELFIEFIAYLSGGITEEYMAMAELVLGENVSLFPTMKVTCRSRLMSGALWTSFQNTFLNLYIMQFLNYKHCAKNGLVFNFSETKLLVEGDDGIMAYIPHNKELTTAMGLDLKVCEAENFTKASFCGRVISNTTCFTEPTKVIDKLAWMQRKFENFNSSKEKALLRCKAISLLMNHAGCPILDPLARSILAQTRNVDHRPVLKFIDEYEREQISTAKYVPERTITESDRALMHDLFEISAHQQREFEKNLAGWKLGQTLILTWSAPDSWCLNHKDTKL